MPGYGCTATLSIPGCPEAIRRGEIIAVGVHVPSGSSIYQAPSGARTGVARSDRHLAVAARQVEHVGRLAQARDSPAQPPHQRLALAPAPVRNCAGAGRQVGMVQVVGLDPHRHEAAEQRLERRGSSLTPRSSTVWPSSGMPACAEPPAGRAAPPAVSSRGWLAWRRHRPPSPPPAPPPARRRRARARRPARGCGSG